MKGPVPPLLGLHAFEVAARTGSFTAAARELHLSQAAVSQRVRTLETHLGVTLFERLPRSLRLTEVGRAYLPAVRDMFEELTAATHGLFGSSGRPRLTVRTQVSYAVTWLGPRLPQFQESFPQVELRVLTSVWADVLPPDDVDLEIRQGNGSWDGFISRRLHDDRAAIFYGPPLREQLGDGVAVADLVDLPCARVIGFEDLWPRALETLPPDQERRPGEALMVDTSVVALSAIEHGALWTILPERFARLAVRQARAFRTCDPLLPMRQAHYLLRPDDGRPMTPEATSFTRWLRAQDALDGP